MITRFLNYFFNIVPPAIYADIQGPAVEDDYTAAWFIGGIMVLCFLLAFIIGRKTKGE